MYSKASCGDTSSVHAVCEKVFHHPIMWFFLWRFPNLSPFIYIFCENGVYLLRCKTWCENGFMSTIKDFLQFAAFGKRHNLCWNEQTCPGAQWNTADKFLNNRRGWASRSSKFGALWKLSSSGTGLKATARESFTLGNSWCLFLLEITLYYFIYIYI